MRHKLRTAVFIIMLLILSTQTSFAEVPVIFYQNESYYPPFRFQHDGQYDGFEVEMTNMIFRDEDYTVMYSNDTWDKVYERLRVGLIDTCGMLAVTDDREGEVLYTNPIYKSYISIYSKKDGIDVNLDNLKNFKVAVGEDQFSESLLKNKMGIDNYVAFKTIDDAIDALARGQVDALFENQEVVNYMLIQKGLKGVIVPKVTNLFPIDIAYGVKKDNPELVSYINRRIAELKESGVYEAIYQKYFYSHSDYYNQLQEANTRRLVVILVLAAAAGFLVLYIYTKFLKKKIYKINKELYERHEQMRVTLSSIGDGVVAADADGNVEYINRTAMELMAVKREDVIYKPISEILNIIDENNRERISIPTERVMESNKQVWMEGSMLLVTNSGNELSIVGSFSPIKDDDHKVTGIVFVFHDTTESKRANDIIRHERDFSKSIVDYAGIFIIVLNQDADIVQFNKYAQDVSGYSQAEVIGKKWIGTLVSEENITLLRQMNIILKSGKIPPAYEIPVICKNGRVIHVLWNNSILYNKDGKSDIIIAMGSDITERKYAEMKLSQSYQELEEVHEELAATEEELRAQYNELEESQDALRESEERYRNLALYDSITGLPNRVMLMSILHDIIDKTDRSPSMACLLFLDLDGFKSVNDTLGHAYGDQVLRVLGDRLKKDTGKDGIVARLSGDEFVILFPEIKKVEDIKSSADRVLQLFQQPVSLDGHEIYVTSSIGIAVYPDDGTDGETLIRNADIAMYWAKERGKNNYQLYNQDMDMRIVKRLKLESSLRYAIKHGELSVYYQPIINISTGVIIEMEALIRWNHPKNGYISPMDFIPLAEETGLIVPIGEFVLRTACKQNKAWQDAGYPAMRISVNMSSRQFQQQNLIDEIQKILSETGLEPRWLSIEITESVAIQDLDHTIATIGKLKNMGIEVLLDDFGTGYSSLNYLKKLPIDSLKIDKSFVGDLTGNSNEIMIIKAIIMLAHSMDLKVVAEGVETKEQLGFLKGHECDMVQGYLFSKPLPPSELEHILKCGGAF